MTQLEAAALVDRQRRRWRCHDSDKAITRRGVRAYAWAAGVQFFVALAEAVLATVFKRPALLFTAVGFFIGALILFWCSRRFTQVMLMLGSAENFEPKAKA